MSDNLFIFAAAVVVVLVVAIIFVGLMFDRKRTEAFARLAERTGMFFNADASEPLSRLPQFHLFTLGHGRHAKRWLRGGQGGEELWIFDYFYVTGHGKNRHTHTHTIAAFPRLETHLPVFQLRPETIFHKIGSALGYRDIDFEEHPEFSKRYLLRGPSEHAIRPLFTHSRITSLMGMESICVEADETSLLVYSPRGRLSPEAIPDLIERAHAARKLFTDDSSSGLKYRLT